MTPQLPFADKNGRPFEAGQDIVQGYLSGCAPLLAERTVLSVNESGVLVSPILGGQRPQYLKHPKRCLILNRLSPERAP